MSKPFNFRTRVIPAEHGNQIRQVLSSTWDRFHELALGIQPAGELEPSDIMVLVSKRYVATMLMMSQREIDEALNVGALETTNTQNRRCATGHSSIDIRNVLNFIERTHTRSSSVEDVYRRGAELNDLYSR